MDCLTNEKAERLNGDSREIMVFLSDSIKHGIYTLDEWKNSLEVEIPEDMDLYALSAKEQEVSNKFAVIRNNLFLARAIHRAASASKERLYSSNYAKLANVVDAGKRKTATVLEQEVMAAIENEMDALLYAETIMDFWLAQEAIISSRKETLKNLFWIVKEQKDNG
jgi:hypothetical protein